MEILRFHITRAEHSDSLQGFIAVGDAQSARMVGEPFEEFLGTLAAKHSGIFCLALGVQMEDIMALFCIVREMMHLLIHYCYMPFLHSSMMLPAAKALVDMAGYTTPRLTHGPFILAVFSILTILDSKLSEKLLQALTEA